MPGPGTNPRNADSMNYRRTAMSPTMKRVFFALSASGCCLLGSTVAMADAHSDRQALMRANTKASQAIDTLVIGILNRDKIKDQVKILVDNGAQIAALFGPGTDQNDPAVKPEIWSDAAGFKAADDKFVSDAKVFLTAPDRVALATALIALQADCAACHRTYRVAPAAPPVVAGGRGGPQVAANVAAAGQVANAGQAANGAQAANAGQAANGGNANAAQA